jgi:hypothetical protein
MNLGFQGGKSPRFMQKVSSTLYDKIVALRNDRTYDVTAGK